MEENYWNGKQIYRAAITKLWTCSVAPPKAKDRNRTIRYLGDKTRVGIVEERDGGNKSSTIEVNHILYIIHIWKKKKSV